MIKTFNFGKVDFNNCGRKINLITVEVEYNDGRFSVSGNVWNSKETDVISGGQNLDELLKFLNNNDTFVEIYLLWKQYHLNDLNAGTPLQTAYLKGLNKPKNADFYTWECKQLEKVNLLWDKWGGKPYKYGTKWLKIDIPQNVDNTINNLLNN